MLCAVRIQVREQALCGARLNWAVSLKPWVLWTRYFIPENTMEPRSRGALGR